MRTLRSCTPGRIRKRANLTAGAGETQADEWPQGQWFPSKAASQGRSSVARKTSSRDGAQCSAIGADLRAPTLGSKPPRSCRLSPSDGGMRSEEHTSELQSLMRISYAVFCLKKQRN